METKIIDGRIAYLKLVLTLALLVGHQSIASAKKQFEASDYIAFGETFTENLQAENLAALDKQINLEAFSHRVAKTIFNSESEIAAFKKPFIKGMRENSFAKKIFFNAPKENITIHFLGLTGRNRPLIRIDYPEGGHEYIRLHVGPNEQNMLAAYDFFFASTGSYSSESVGSASQLLFNPNRTFLAKLFGVNGVDESLSNNFDQIAKFRGQGKFQAAYDIILDLPKVARDHEVIAIMAIGVASGINEELYRKELTNLAETHGKKEKYAFMLIDHYFYQEDWEKAIASVETVKKQWKDDGAINVLHSTILNLSGDSAGALKYAKRAIEIEPQLENAYWTVLDLSIKSNDYQTALEAMDVLTTDFNMEFTEESVSSVPEYKNFAESKVFQDWLKK